MSFRNPKYRKRALRLGMTVGMTLSVWLQAGCRAEEPWPLWDQYTERFMDPQGRIIDRSAQDRTTSEGQAYAMFFALVADDRPRFDKLLNWTEANLADGDLTLHLPAWNWGKAGDGTWKVLDQNPAADADLWMAYTLLEAGRLWRVTRYEKLGSVIASRIAQQEVVRIPGVGTTIVAAPHGFHPDPTTWLLNPSYLPPPVLERLARAMPQGPWRSVLDSLRPLLAQGSGAGYAMDWVSAGTTVHPSASPAELAQGHKDAPALGSYDAIRMYLWLGISDPSTPGVRQMLKIVNGMAGYLNGQVTPPLQVDSTGKILNPDAPIGFSAAVIPYLLADGMKSQARVQMDRLAATRDPLNGLYGRGAEYYDQNLALFTTGWTEQRYHFDREGTLKLKWK